MPQLQQDFQKLFAGLGGLEMSIMALEGHLESIESPDLKPRNLQLMLGLISRVGNARVSWRYAVPTWSLAYMAHDPFFVLLDSSNRRF